MLLQYIFCIRAMKSLKIPLLSTKETPFCFSLLKRLTWFSLILYTWTVLKPVCFSVGCLLSICLCILRFVTVFDSRVVKKKGYIRKHEWNKSGPRWRNTTLFCFSASNSLWSSCQIVSISKKRPNTICDKANTEETKSETEEI